MKTIINSFKILILCGFALLSKESAAQLFPVQFTTTQGQCIDLGVDTISGITITTFNIVSGPFNGQLVPGARPGSWIYCPDSLFVGNDQVTVYVCISGPTFPICDTVYATFNVQPMLYPFPQPDVDQVIVHIGDWTTGNAESDASFRYVSDTIMCGKTYQKFLSNHIYYSVFYTRYDNGKVYFTYNNCASERLQYDFGMGIGDTFNLHSLFPVVIVDSIGTITTQNGQQRKLLRLTDTYSQVHFWWADGIGDIEHGFFYYFDFEGGHEIMVCHKEASQLVYTNPTSGYDCDSLVLADSLCNHLSVALITSTQCPGPLPGLEAYVTGGTLPVIYQWTQNGITIPGLTNYVACNLDSGNYCVSVTDVQACTVSTCMTVDTNCHVGAYVTTIGPYCYGESGVLTVTGNGGIHPYSYLWSTGATSASITVSPLSTTAYSVTVTDNTNCAATAIGTIYVPRAITANISQQLDSINCPGGTKLQLSSTGGTPPYTYSWSTGQITTTICVTLPGNYCVTITDANACSTILCSVVGSSCNLSGNIYEDSVVCGFFGTGLTAYMTGGTPPYYYAWSNGDTTQTICVSTPGTYCLTVGDAVGCDTTLCYAFSGCQLSTFTFKDQNGFLIASAGGGIPPFDFIWSDGQTGSAIFPTLPGTYCVTVTDSIGCSATGCYPPGGCNMSVTLYPDSTPCMGPLPSVGSGVFGGTPPYTYLWSDNSIGEFICNLTPGTYCLTVIDAQGCTDSSCYSIGGCQMVATITPGSSRCLNVSVIGGLAPYNFIWSDSSTSSSLCNVTLGDNYCVTVTDSSGCTSTTCGNICQGFTVSPFLFLNCIDAGEGGGTSPYSYIWSTGDSVAVLCHTTGGIYCVTVTDANNCTDSNCFNTQNQGNCSFSYSPVFVQQAGLSPYTILFTATYDSLFNPSNVFWDFGDGDTASGFLFIHDFDTCNLYYNVTMILKDSLGNIICSNSQNIYVSCFPTPFCQARFRYSQDSTNNLTYHFIDQSVYNPVAFVWDFGDSGTSSNQNPSQTYTTAGIYNVCLVITDSTGCSSTYCEQINAGNFQIQDLSANLFHFTTVTPGFPLWVRLTYCNNGTTAMSGTVQYRYPVGVTLTNSTPAFTSHDSTQRLLSYNFSNLLPGTCRTIAVDLAVSSSLQLGSIADDTMWVLPIAGDITPANNVSTISTVVVGSWDPNDKANSPKGWGDDGEIPVGTQQLSYHIRFQNTGLAPAQTVEIRDRIDDNIDLSSIKVSEASHSHTTQMVGKELVVTFNNIQLPDSNTNEAASHGYIVVNAMLKPGLTAGTQIFNTADIYFDLNSPIITNTVVNTLKDTITGIRPTAGLNFSILPNPARDEIIISGKFNRNTVFEIMNELGQMVLNGDIVADKTSVSIEKLSSGIYLVKVKSKDKTGIQRLVVWQ